MEGRKEQAKVVFTKRSKIVKSKHYSKFFKAHLKIQSKKQSVLNDESVIIAKDQQPETVPNESDSYNRLINASPTILPPLTAVSNENDQWGSEVPEMIEFVQDSSESYTPFKELISKFAVEQNLPPDEPITTSLMDVLLIDPINDTKRENTKFVRNMLCFKTKLEHVYYVKDHGTLIRYVGQTPAKKNKLGVKTRYHHEMFCKDPNCDNISFINASVHSLYCDHHNLKKQGKILICKDKANVESSVFIVIKYPFAKGGPISTAAIPPNLVQEKINSLAKRNDKISNYLSLRAGKPVNFETVFESDTLQYSALPAHYYSALFMLTIAMMFDESGPREILNPTIMWSHVAENGEVLEFYRKLIVPHLQVEVKFQPAVLHSSDTKFYPVSDGKGNMIYVVVTTNAAGVRTVYTGVNTTSEGTMSPCHYNIDMDATMLGRHRSATGDPITHEIKFVSLGEGFSDRDAEGMSLIAFALAAAFNCEFHSLRFKLLNQRLIIPSDFSQMAPIITAKLLYLMGIQITLDDSVRKNPFLK